MAHKLLVADDSVTIQRVIELTFADEPIEVVTVGDGAQAIAHIEAERPDIVLADAGMPEKDGYDVAAYVKSREHLRHIPVLLLTGAFEPVDEARARAAGCDGVLVKPFEPQVVIARVKDLLAGRRPPGLWAAPPGPEPRAAGRPAAQEAPAGGARLDYKTFAETTEPPAEPAPRPAVESLEEYFDRLDAAFAGLGAEQGPAPAPAGEPEEESASVRAEVESWDPSLGSAPVGLRPQDAPAAAVERPHAAERRPPETSPGAAPPAAAAPPPAAPSLAEAFAALLEAEQGQATPAPAASAPAAVSDEVIDAVVTRVIERMTSQVVRETVLEVAERLVREEIARIKRAVP